MMSHSYVSYLKKTRWLSPEERPLPNKKSEAAKRARLLVRASVKRLSPKVPIQLTAPSVEQPQPIPNQQKIGGQKTARKPIKDAKRPIKQKKPRASSSKAAKNSAILALASTSGIENGQLLERPSSSLGWQSCKLKIKIPLFRVDAVPRSSETRSPKKGQSKPSKRKAPANPVKSPKKAKQALPLNKKQTLEESLTCPTCDKLFMSKSILERHLLKSKHGIFTQDKDLTAPHPMISQALDKAMAEGKQLPHMNQITQPKMEVGGREVNKYECHLCKQVFLRVKDLAKHRERMMCSAWFNK